MLPVNYILIKLETNFTDKVTQMVKNPHAGDLGLIPGLGRCPGEGNGYPLQYSCLEKSMDRVAKWATVHGITKSQKTEQRTLSFFTFQTHREREREREEFIANHLNNLEEIPRIVTR